MTLWFRTKTYGWGWTPATWQGWCVLVVWGIVVATSVHAILHHVHDEQRRALSVVVVVGVLSCVLIAVCFITGEPPRWRWGKYT